MLVVVVRWDFNISEISLIVNSIIANFEFVLNSKLGGLQLLSSKFDMVQRNKVNNMIIHAKQQFFLNSSDFLDENSSDPKLF
jgi:hypothetical protein